MRFAVAVVPLLLLPVAVASHADPCFATGADPSTVIVIDTPDGKRFYDEERGNPFGTPIPLLSILLGPDGDDADPLPEPFDGEGSRFFEESNGLDGLQRGTTGWYGEGFPPGCDGSWLFDEDNLTDLPNGTGPCVQTVFDEPITDETCHAGPDSQLL